MKLRNLAAVIAALLFALPALGMGVPVSLYSTGVAHIDSFVGGSLPPDVTFARASTATHYNSSGILIAAGNNVPRFDYNPSTLTPNGLLMEGASTNEIPTSQIDANADGWTESGSTVGGTSMGPDGISSLRALNDTSSSVGHFISGGSFAFVSGAAYTASVYAAANAQNIVQIAFPSAAFGSTAYATFQLSGAGSVTQQGASGTGSIQLINNGIYRLFLTATATGSASGSSIVIGLTNNQTAAAKLPVYVGSGTGAYIGFAQTEPLPFATSYISTTGSVATRQADGPPVAASIPWFNASAGTIVTSAITYTAINFPGDATFSDGSNNNEIYQCASSQGFSGTGPIINAVVGGVSTQIQPLGTSALNTIGKMATSYKGTAWNSSANASAVSSFTSTVPPVTELLFGAQGNGGSLKFGWIQSLSYWNYALSSTRLQALSR